MWGGPLAATTHTNAAETGSAAALTHSGAGQNTEPSTGRRPGGYARMQAFPHTRRAHAYATHRHTLPGSAVSITGFH